MLMKLRVRRYLWYMEMILKVHVRRYLRYMQDATEGTSKIVKVHV